MAATVDFREWNGTVGSPTKTVKTSSTVRMKAIDSASVDANNPLPKPSTGNITRSYEKWLRLYIGATGPTGQITSPRWYTDGANGFGTGISLYVRTTNPGVYAQPAKPTSDAAGTDAFTYTSGSPKALDSVNAGPFSGTALDIADYLVMWMSLADTVTAPQNTTASETITFAWDET